MNTHTATMKAGLVYISFFVMVLIAIAGTLFLTYRAYRFQKVYDAEMAKENAAKLITP